ncbi:MAG: sulfatase-like hydrolase/transferase [Pirellulaceae bacterium]|nr:sulfatase-like hydrolase/transferase [Pirellulaceae bacterium]
MTSNEHPQPNVIIFFTDDHGSLDANCYGASDLLTPNIDRLAETGIRFTQAYSHTVCCPARAMLLTGRYPQRSGITTWTQGDMNGAAGRNMPLDEYTLAEALQDSGYTTGLFGKWHLGAHKDYGPKKQGFDHFFGLRGGFIDNYNHHFLHGNGFPDLYDGTTRVNAKGDYFPELMTERSLKFIDHNKHRPFFLYAAFNIPHYPEQSLTRFREPYKDLTDPARRSYNAVLTTTDHYIGKIIQKIEEHGLRESTIMILMGDNGHSEETTNRIRTNNHTSGLAKEYFYGASGGGYTGKWRGCKGTFLEGGIRVPAIISYPAGLPQHETRDQIITAMDWYPTILDLCNITRKPNAPIVDGHSVLPFVRSASLPSAYRGVLHFGWANQWAIRDGDWKLIGKTKSAKDEAQALFNLADVEPEATNHLQHQPRIVKRLLSLHQQWARNVKRQSL